MTTFFGFGLADNMFPLNCEMTRCALTPEEARGIVKEGVEACLNPSHAATICVMRERFDIEVTIPPKAPIVSLKPGDRLLIMAVSGLPRLEGRHEYTPEEVKAATFRFGIWTVRKQGWRYAEPWGDTGGPPPHMPGAL
jgi:hypothetical protein